MAGAMPGPGQRCVDAGACPGGWTWALAGLGSEVMAIDRAPIDPAVAAMPGVTFLKHNAFTLKPQDIGPVDWFCSDVICYPPALYEWVALWLESGMARNFICTIKMQGGQWDQPTVQKFADIPGSIIFTRSLIRGLPIDDAFVEELVDRVLLPILPTKKEHAPHVV